MAGEGLFFAGTVLKNNRDLIKEDMAREELELKKEQLELQKQAAANKRKDARKKNQPKALGFSSSSMGGELGARFQKDVLEYQKRVNASSIDESSGSVEAMNLRSEDESGLTTTTNVYNEVYKEVLANRALAQGNSRNSLGTNENGGYVFEDNYASFLEAIDSGMSATDALSQFPIGQGAINETKWENPINALYKDKMTLKDTDRTDGSSYEEYTGFSTVSDDLEEGLTPDKNGNWNNPYFKDIYLGEKGLVSANGVEEMMSYPAAFAFETRGIPLNGEDTTFTDKLTPGSETYDADLSNEYIKYIKQKSEDKAKIDYPRRETKGKTLTKEEKDGTALSQDKIDFFMGASEEIESYGLSELKVSPNFGEDVTDAGIIVSLTKSSPIKEQGDEKLKEFNDLLSVSNSEGTDAPAEGKVSWVGMTTSGKTVARVEFSGQSFLIDLADIASERNHVKPGATTALDLFKLAEGGSKSSSKGNKEKVSW